MFKSLRIPAFIVVSLLLLSFGSLAQDSGDRKAKRRGHKKTPVEAFNACASKAKGDACSFEGRRGDDVNGQCVGTRDSDKLRCRPEGRKRHRRNQESAS